MARLIIATAEGQRPVELRPHNSLGRHPSNTIQLLDRIVSKEHCIVELRTDGFWLRDLGSLNGTYVSQERVEGERALRHGDEIVMGGTRIWYDDGRGLSVAEPSMVGGTPQSAVIPAAVTRPPAGLAAMPAVPQAPPPQPYMPPMPSYGGPPAATNISFAPFAPPMPPPAAALPRPQPPVPPAPVRVSNRPLGTMAIPAFAAEGQRLAHLGQIDLTDQQRAIGTQIAATEKGFRPFEQIATDPVALRADYERLRLSHELSREIALEPDTTRLLAKILQSIFKFVHADRGVIFLLNEEKVLLPGASLRRDGSEAPIVVSNTILNHVQNEKAAVLTHDAAMDFANSKGKSMILNRISSAIVVPLLHNDDFLGVIWLDAESLAQFQPKDLEIVAGVAAQAALFIENNILAKKIEREIVTRERFSRLLSPNIAERVASGELKVEKGGQLVSECTVFNSDIRGFTRMSSTSDPQVIVDMLNEYFELMVETLFKYEGTLDKFMGDGLMALWGAPIAHRDDPFRAVDCALEQMEVLGRFNRERITRSQPPLGIGIGVHTGPLVAGYIGSSKALSYTVIGDTVNTSARLCSHALMGQVIVSESTFEKIRSKYEYERLEPAKVKGKEHPLQIVNILRRNPTLAVG